MTREEAAKKLITDTMVERGATLRDPSVTSVQITVRFHPGGMPRKVLFHSEVEKDCRVER